MCIIEEITYVYADGYHVIQPYHRLCDAAVGGHPCEATRRYDLGARRLNTPLYTTSPRSPRPSSSNNPVPEPGSPSQLGRKGSMKSSKETKRTFVKDRTVYRRRGSQILSEPGNASLTEEGRPKRSSRTFKHDVVVTQDNPPRSPVTPVFAAQFPRRERHSDPDKTAKLPSSGRSSAAYSPTLSSSSAEPITVLRSPLVVNDARSSIDSSRVPSLQASTPDAPRPAYRPQRPHRPSASLDQSYRSEAFGQRPRPDSPRTPTDIETSSMSDLDPTESGLARDKYREQMRENNAEANRVSQMESLRTQLANLEAQEQARREERRDAEDRRRIEREHARRIASERSSQRLDRATLDDLDKKRQTRTEGHRLRSGDVATTQTTRQRPGARSQPPATPIEEDAADDESDEGETQQPSQGSSGRRRRRKRRSQHHHEGKP